MPVKVFCCYAHEDEPLLKRLKTQLSPMQRQGLIDIWHDRDISAGREWEQEISQQLNAAQIILLLVSPDFMASDYCYGTEMKRALERHKRKEARVIPVILRPVDWRDILGDIQALPTDGKPVLSSLWHSQDDAFFDVAQGIRKVVMELTSRPASASLAVPGERQQEVTEPGLSPSLLRKLLDYSDFLSPPAVEKPTLIRTFTDHKGWVWSVALSADGQTLVSGSEDKTIKVWDLSTGKKVRTIAKGHTEGVHCVALSADGQTLVSGSDDKTIKVWNLPTGKEVHNLTGHYSWVWSVALSADGQTLVSGSNDETIKVWDLSTGKEVRTLSGHTGRVNCVALSADGQTLVSGSEDKTIKVWNLSTGKKVRTLSGHTGGVNSVALSADGHTLISGSEDKTIKLWDLSTGKEVRTLSGHTDVVYCVALSADGHTLVSGSADFTIKVWDLSTGKEVHTLSHTPTFCVALSADGHTLVSGGLLGEIKVWSI